ncbi:SIMPL domain-containing protein [Nakamurella leprariae]|uniref:SIMPL domain-containing protein n=1 Tax=Nakamurella leprariae TaxID=2803911 RepID=A0A938YIF1_9ACTN|nr:SIMPL domain-containing protein [Nakamurella leprariae]MBM9468907.1 SIMPL domain-containing protein [Nakamurella leprariae]
MIEPSDVDAGSSVTVSGTGSAATPVDRATVRLNVDVLRPDPGEAFRDAATTSARVLALVAGQGVEARHVRTQDISLGPRSDYHAGQERLLGYAATQRLSVELPRLDGIEQLLSDLAADSDGGLRIDGVTFSATDLVDASVVARERAFDDARTKAEHYAALSGRQLGRVLRLEEGAAPVVPMLRESVALAASAGPPMPVAAGDADVTVGIIVVWELR